MNLSTNFLSLPFLDYMQQPPPQIIEGCKNNDRRAQQELFRHCYPFLMNVCTRYRKNDQEAKAVLNAGFLKIFTKISQYNPKIPFAVWARKIVVNTLIDDFRKYKKLNETVVNRDFSDSYDLDDGFNLNSADLNFDAEHLLKFVNELPKSANKVFNLFAIDGYSHKEIAEALGISEGTSKWHLNDARKRLVFMIKKSQDTLNKKDFAVASSAENRKKLPS